MKITVSSSHGDPMSDPLLLIVPMIQTQVLVPISFEEADIFTLWIHATSAIISIFVVLHFVCFVTVSFTAIVSVRQPHNALTYLHKYVCTTTKLQVFQWILSL